MSALAHICELITLF